MRVTGLVGTVALVTFDQLARWRYGPVGVIALLLLLIGIKARNHTCSTIGAVALALLVTRPAL
ncbi:hypothetical protein ABZT04_29935 [Streptomyces sp. NPDC005492]|uniref:hypothetical protein n=1 Tax=Streptomyces sp. NPDC005492 TaxID=3156883 RepID=UPI0033AE6420